MDFIVLYSKEVVLLSKKVVTTKVSLFIVFALLCYTWVEFTEHKLITYELSLGCGICFILEGLELI